eukprot:1195875-Prorocentrum_minimum.AAC.4
MRSECVILQYYNTVLLHRFTAPPVPITARYRTLPAPQRVSRSCEFETETLASSTSVRSLVRRVSLTTIEREKRNVRGGFRESSDRPRRARPTSLTPSDRGPRRSPTAAGAADGGFEFASSTGAPGRRSKRGSTRLRTSTSLDNQDDPAIAYSTITGTFQLQVQCSYSAVTVRVPLIAAVFNSRVPILAASEPTAVAAYPGDFSAFNSRCPY